MYQHPMWLLAPPEPFRRRPLVVHCCPLVKPNSRMHEARRAALVQRASVLLLLLLVEGCPCHRCRRFIEYSRSKIAALKQPPPTAEVVRHTLIAHSCDRFDSVIPDAVPRGPISEISGFYRVKRDRIGFPKHFTVLYLEHTALQQKIKNQWLQDGTSLQHCTALST